jgi:hypothetical protein
MLRGLSLIGKVVLIFGVSIGLANDCALAQETSRWMSPSRAISVNVPEGWTEISAFAPDVLIAWRSPEADSGHPVVGCAVEQHVVAENVSLTREQANALTPMALDYVVTGSTAPTWSWAQVDNISVASVEVTPPHAPATERDFGRIFLWPDQHSLIRFSLLCVVQSGLPTSERNSALAHQFLDSLAINSEAQP